jgi:nitrogen regulatory protein P-II 2|tara:strand:+ start:595 stop:975 length:381 start_codon:yes stop_codon:yes gene_type:complete
MSSSEQATGQEVMKRIVAVIKPYKFDEVQESLGELVETGGITLTDVRGFGRQHGHVELYRGAEYVAAFFPKVQLEAAVEDHHVDQVVDAIMQAAITGNTGDGKVFVLPLTETIGIQTEQSLVGAVQ